VPAVKLLLAKGANVNAVSGDGSFQKVKAGTIALGNWTPLLRPRRRVTGDDRGAARRRRRRQCQGCARHDAADARRRNGSSESRRRAQLIDRKADVNVRSLAGETALDWARKIGNPSVVRMLERAGGAASRSRAAVPADVRPGDTLTAVRKSLALLEKSSTEAASKGGCASCHHHNITDIAGMAARDKGIALDEKAAANRRQLTRARFFDPANFFERLEGAGFPT
jgi:hypothetical protein